MNTSKTVIIAVAATVIVAVAVILVLDSRAKKREEELRRQYEASLAQAQQRPAGGSPVVSLVSSILSSIF